MARTRQGHDGMRMPAWIRRWVYGTSIATAATGILWLLLHTFVRQEGEFGPEPYWAEPHLLSMHGAAAMLALWMLGLVWLPHVRRGWHQKRNRKMGVSLVAIALVLAISGWALYYVGGESVRPVLSVLHWAVGLVAVAWLPFHVWHGRRDVPGG